MFVVPGNITSAESRGSNELIKDGATLITRPSEILREYQIRCGGALQEDEADRAQEAYHDYLEHGQEPIRRTLRVADGTKLPVQMPCPDGASDLAKAVYAVLTDTPITAEELCSISGIQAGKLFSGLTELELYGCARSYPGKRYSR